MTRYFYYWWLAVRPHTLTASLAPVLVGSSVAFSEGIVVSWVACLTVLGCMLAQMGANLVDEAADHHQTTSSLKYAAPHKVIARGLLSARAVQIGGIIALGLGVLCSVVLWLRGGWPIVAVTTLGVVVAYFYSAGPKPLGNIGMGEGLVFLAMGPMIVMPVAYLHTLQWSALAFWASLPVGCLVTALLVANNLRDLDEDRAAGKVTLATCLGAPKAQIEYGILLGFSFLIPIALWLANELGQAAAMVLLALPVAWHCVGLSRQTSAHQRHATLKRTALLHIVFSVLLSAAVALS